MSLNLSTSASCFIDTANGRVKKDRLTEKRLIMKDSASPSLSTRTKPLWRLSTGFWIIGTSALIVGMTATSPLTFILLTILFSVVSFGDAGYWFLRSQGANRNAVGIFLVLLGGAGLAAVWLTWNVQAIPLWGRMALAALWAIAGQLTFVILLTPGRPPQP